MIHAVLSFICLIAGRNLVDLTLMFSMLLFLVIILVVGLVYKFSTGIIYTVISYYGVEE